MAKFLAGVLSVIAVGVLLIAYGLLNPRAAAFDPRAEMAPFARPMLAGEQVTLADEYAARYGYYRPGAVGYGAPAYAPQPYSQVGQPQAIRTSQVVTAPRRVTTTRTVERAPGRDWKKTALVIGGTTAAGAGLGGIFGGKKGALIGAAIGGGASTLYEATKK